MDAQSNDLLADRESATPPPLDSGLWGVFEINARELDFKDLQS